MIEQTKENIPAFVDKEGVLDRLGGNIALFFKLLYRMREEYTDVAIKIKNLLDADDKQGAKFLAHTIKGAAANMGIKKLQEAAGELEKSLLEENEVNIKETLSKFEQAVKETIGCIEKE